MSNIQDITSLSDLLNTSPREPPEVNEPFLASAESDDDDQDLPTSGTQVQDSTTQLELQKEKIRLNEIRDTLINKRTKLKSEIEALGIQNMKLLDQRKRKQAQDKIEQLQTDDQAADESIEVNLEVTNSGLEMENEKLIFQKLNVLPSDDWPDRIRYAKMLYPSIEIQDLTNDETNPENRVISYTIVCHNFFKLTLQIHISKSSNKLIKIVLPHKHQLLAVSLISQSFYDVLAKRYVPNLKLPHIMNGVFTMAEAVVNKKRVLDKIRSTFSAKVSHCSLNSVTFLSSKDLTILFQWDIALEDTISGDVKSNLRLFITNTTISETCDSSQLLIDMIKESGDVYEGLSSLLFNTYQLKPNTQGIQD